MQDIYLRRASILHERLFLDLYARNVCGAQYRFHPSKSSDTLSHRVKDASYFK